MTLDEYIQRTRMRKGVFSKSIGIAPSVLFRYRKQTLRPSYLHATKIVKFTHGLIAWEDLGWTEEGERIKPWTKKELKNNLNPDGMQNNDPLPADTLDGPEKEGSCILQPEGQGEKERHCVG